MSYASELLEQYQELDEGKRLRTAAMAAMMGLAGLGAGKAKAADSIKTVDPTPAYYDMEAQYPLDTVETSIAYRKPGDAEWKHKSVKTGHSKTVKDLAKKGHVVSAIHNIEDRNKKRGAPTQVQHGRMEKTDIDADKARELAAQQQFHNDVKSGKTVTDRELHGVNVTGVHRPPNPPVQKVKQSAQLTDRGAQLLKKMQDDGEQTRQATRDFLAKKHQQWKNKVIEELSIKEQLYIEGDRV